MTLRILLAGEGPGELGGWAAEPQYRGVARQRRDARRSEPPFMGVLEAFLATIAPGAFEIVDAVLWKSLPFYRSLGGNRTERPMSKEELNVRALSLLAHDRACDAVVYVRDRDRSEERQQDLHRGREALDRQAVKAGLRVAGGVSVECIEAWVLAVCGNHASESLSPRRAKESVRKAGLDSAAALADAIQTYGLANVASDAASLHLFLREARSLFE